MIIVQKENIPTFVLSVYLMFFCTELTAQSMWEKYANFTPERRIVLEKMGDFFEKTIRENYPEKMDSSSYKEFFRCIIDNSSVSDMPYVIQVNRKKLAKINDALFKDEIYYFFYAKYLTIKMEDGNEMFQHYDDTIPTVRSYTNKNTHYEIQTWYPVLYNPDGYIQRILEESIENPAIYEMNKVMKLSRNYDIIGLITNLLIVGNLREMSNPVVKQLTAMFFWRYICFCGGVDLVRRKGFCDECGLKY
jgi:hypothetical protein